MNLIEVTLADLKDHPHNPHKHPDAQVDGLEKSVSKYGQYKNIVVWRGHILAGHGLRKAALKAGLTTLQAIDMSHLSESDAVSLMLADIRLPDMAIIDEAEIVEALKVVEEALSVPGFDEEFLAGIGWGDVEPKEEPGPPPVDKAEELREQWGTELGQLWALGQHRVVCGDCTDRAVVERVMGGERADLEIHDPPYGMRLDTDWSNAKSRLDFAAENPFFGGKNHKPVHGDFADFDPSFLFDRQMPKELFLWGADYYAERIPNRNDGSWLVWDKRIDESADKMYGSCFETLWSIKKHKRDIIRVKWAGIFGTEHEPGHKRFHPTQKPVQVYKWIIERHSNIGDICADFYLGAGSHLIAAHQLSRRCYGIELDPGYVAVTLQRYLDLTGDQPHLIT